MGYREQYQELEEFEKKKGYTDTMSDEEKKILAAKAEKEYRMWSAKRREKAELLKEYTLEVPYDKQNYNHFQDYLRDRGYTDD